MAPAQGWYQWDQNDLILRLRVQPRASRDGFAGPLGERFKVRITAPPVDGEANAHLIRFLAKAFGVPQSQVRLLSGENARNKDVRIQAPKKIPIPAENQ